MTPLTAPSTFDARRQQPGHFWVFLYSRNSPPSVAAYAFVASYEREHAREAVLVAAVEDSPAVTDHVSKALGIHVETPMILLVEYGRLGWHATGDEVTQTAMELAHLPAL